MIQLSRKELDIIQQQIQSELNLVSIFRSYSNETLDPELKIVYQKISAINMNSYQKLINLLKG